MTRILNNKTYVYIIISLIIVALSLVISLNKFDTERKIEKINKIEAYYLIKDNLQNSNFITALRLIKRSLKQYPNDPDLMLQLSALYFSTGCYDEAEEVLKKIVKSEKYNKDAYLLLGQIYTLKAQDHKAIKTYEDLLGFLKSTSDIDNVYNLLVERCMKIGDNEKAVKHANSSLLINKNNGIMLAFKGKLNLKQNPKLALDMTLKAYKINNKSYKIIICLSELYMEQKKYKEALQVLNKARILFPYDSKIYLLLAKSYYNEQDYYNTFDNLIKTVQLNQDELVSDDYNQIVNICDNLLKDNSSVKELYEVSAAALIRLKDYKKAISLLLKAIKNELDVAEIHNNLGGIYLQISTKEAIKEYQTAVKKDSKNYIYAYGLAHAYKKDGNVNKAIEYTNKALLLNPNFATGEVNLGDLYKSQSKITEATLHYRKALKIDGSQAFAYLGMGDIFLDKKMYEEASWNYENFLKFSNDSKENAIVLKKAEKIILFFEKN